MHDAGDLEEARATETWHSMVEVGGRQLGGRQSLTQVCHLHSCHCGGVL